MGKNGVVKMKVFVYTKEPKPKKVAVISDVTKVCEYKELNTLCVETSSGFALTYDTRLVKTTIYQN